MLSTANKVIVSAQKKCVLKEKIHFPYLQVFSIIPSAIILQLGVLHGTISHHQHQVMTLYVHVVIHLRVLYDVMTIPMNWIYLSATACTSTKRMIQQL